MVRWGRDMLNAQARRGMLKASLRKLESVTGAYSFCYSILIGPEYQERAGTNSKIALFSGIPRMNLENISVIMNICS